MNLKVNMNEFFKHIRPVRPWRPQWLPKKTVLLNEANIHPHSPEEKAGTFLSSDAGSTEMEVLNWLYATICLVKAENILETGTLNAMGTIALASACKANGFGHVHTIEIDPKYCALAEQTLKKEGLLKYVSIHCCDSLDFLRTTDLHFDFAFIDSLCEIRVEEYSICMERCILKGMAVFHDTSPTRAKTYQYPSEAVHNKYRQDIYEIIAKPGVSGYFESPLSRGLIAVFPKLPIS